MPRRLVEDDEELENGCRQQSDCGSVLGRGLKRISLPCGRSPIVFIVFQVS